MTNNDSTPNQPPPQGTPITPAIRNEITALPGNPLDRLLFVHDSLVRRNIGIGDDYTLMRIYISCCTADTQLTGRGYELFDLLKGFISGTHRQPMQVDTPEYRTYIQSEEWQTRRLTALHAAGQRCQLCNSPHRLEVHHRTYERLGKEEPGDLTVLCDECHRTFHKHRKLHTGGAE